MGARHITFGDPDFLNGRRHSLAIVRALHERLPELTFDCTTKVEHVLEHADVWEEMAASGCLFVVSALESVNDEILARLDKGHTTAEAVLALDLLREHGIETRPSFMPFTPWTTPRDVLEIVDFVAAHDLVANVDPVQYTIRLLVPEGSLLLEREDLREHLGPYDAERLSYPWRSADPAADRLQGRLSALVQQSAAAQEAIGPDVRAHPRGGARGDRRGRRPASRRPSPWDRPRGGHGSPSRGSAERSPPRTSSVLSQRDDMVRRVARQRRVQVGKAADPHARDRSRRQRRADLPLGQAALQRALVTQHQQHSVLGQK